MSDEPESIINIRDHRWVEVGSVEWQHEVMQDENQAQCTKCGRTPLQSVNGKPYMSGWVEVREPFQGLYCPDHIPPSIQAWRRRSPVSSFELEEARARQYASRLPGNGAEHMSSESLATCPHCGAQFQVEQIAGPPEYPPCLACALEGKSPVPTSRLLREGEKA